MQGKPKQPNDSQSAQELASRQDSATAAVGETLTPDSKPAPYDLKEDPLVQRVARRHGISLEEASDLLGQFGYCISSHLRWGWRRPPGLLAMQAREEIAAGGTLAQGVDFI